MSDKLFNLEDLRCSQNFADDAPTKKIVVKVDVRKPGKQEFFRINPAEEYRINMALLETAGEKTFYAVAPTIAQTMATELRYVTLYAAITRSNDIFLCPVSLPGPNGTRNPWHQSLLEAVQIAFEKWVRISANMSNGGYDVIVAKFDISEPEWPNMSLEELMHIACKDRYINSIDHPVLKKLRGEA